MADKRYLGRRMRATVLTAGLALGSAGPALAISLAPPVVVQAPSVQVQLVIASGSSYATSRR